MLSFTNMANTAYRALSPGDEFLRFGDDKSKSKRTMVTGMLTTAVLILIAAAALANLGVSIATFVNLPGSTHYEAHEVGEVHEVHHNLKQTFAPRQAYQQIESGEYDFIVAGGGTGGLAALGRLGAVTLNAGDATKILLLEAGRWLEPALETLSYTLTHNGVLENHKINAPINWPATIDAWIAQYYGNPLSDGSFPTYALGIQNPYVFADGEMVKTTNDNTPLLTVLRRLRDNFLDNPSQRLVTDLPTYTFNLGYVNMSLSGSPSSIPFLPLKNAGTLLNDNNGQWYFTGNPMVLVDPVWSDFRTSQFLNGYGNSEDLFFYEAQYTNSKQTYVQNYPRGKTLGGSSVANAQIHFGFTDKTLSDLADAIKDPTWKSARVTSIVTGCNTLTAHCDYRQGNNIPNDCLGPAFGVPFLPFSDPAFPVPDLNALLGAPIGGVGEVFDSLFADFSYNKNYMMSEFEESKRQQGYVHTSSVNPFSKRHSGSHDVIANLIGLGAKVCFWPSDSHRILSTFVIPDKYHCGKPLGSQARIQIRTGALVTGLTFNDAPGSISRVTGVQWVNEFDQLRPDQNRFDMNAGRQCVPTTGQYGDKYGGSLYGNGLANTPDCKNSYNTMEVFTVFDGTAQNLTKDNELLKRSMATDGDVTYNGVKVVGDRVSYNQRYVPTERALAGLVNVKTVTAKKEVILGLGAPGTTALLIRSGISTKGEHERLKTDILRSRLDVGWMADNFEGVFSLAPTTVGAMFPLAFDTFDNAAIANAGIFKSFLRQDTQWTINKPYDVACYWNNIRNILRVDPATGYEKNLHYFRNLLPFFSSNIYSARSNQFEMGTLFLGDGQSPGANSSTWGPATILPVVGPSMLSEVTGNADIRFKNVRMQLKDKHPLERISWTITNAANKDRCAAVKDNLNDFLRAVKRVYPTANFEFVQLTQRKRPIEEFVLDNTKNFYWTGGAVTTVAQYQAYFNDVTNPIVSGFGYNDGDRSFCDLYNVKLSGHHIMGGAMMGAPDDEMAVTDSRGRVYGIKGLRVSDAALMPTATSGNPWVTIFQVGTVIGNFIAEDWGYDTTSININANPVTNQNHPYYKDNLQVGTPYYPV